MSMIIEKTIEFEARVNKIIENLEKDGIRDFNDWLLYYDPTIDEVIGFVNGYCDKIQKGQFNEIEEFEKIIMLNSIALYTMEMDIQIPSGDSFINYILAIFIETIRKYKMMKDGHLKLIGRVFISDINSCKFIKV